MQNRSSSTDGDVPSQLTDATRPAWFASRQARTAAVVAALAILVVIAAAAVFLWQVREDAVANTTATASNLAQLLREQTQAMFLASDLTIRNIEARLERQPDLPPHDPAFRADLRGLVDEQPYVSALFVIDAGGHVVHDSDWPETPRTSLADRPYFIAHRDNPDLGVYVGEPLLDRVRDRWFVPLVRRLDRPDGSFAGVVGAAVEPRFFEGIYRSLDLSAYDGVLLYHADGTLIARAPALPDFYGRRWPGHPLLASHVAHTPAGAYIGSSFARGPASVGYETVAGFPLVVVTALDLDQALADWRRTALVVGFGVLFIVVLIVLLFVSLQRRNLEREVMWARARMAQRLEAVGHMTGSVAHDFNNVLAAITSGVALIRRGKVTGELLDELVKAAERGKALTEGLLEFARSGGQQRIPHHPDALLRALEFMIRRLVGRRIEVVFSYGGGPGDCLINRSRFDAALLNLVVNAAQAIPGRGRIDISTATVSVGADDFVTPGDYVRIRVADNGVGMSPEVRERVCEPFFTTKGDGGTGLGLAQVRAFMRESGGDLVIDSEEGAGTRVDLFFPCLEKDPR